MNSSIANLLKTLVEGTAVADKVAGLVRAIPYNTKINGKAVVKTIPLACNVTDPTACTDLEVRHLVPDASKRSIIYFEDMGSGRDTKFPASMGRLYTSKLRMVVWMNTKLIGDQCTTGDSFQQELWDAIEIPPYNSGDLRTIRHTVTNVPPVSNAIFSRYTYAEAERQFLTWPYSYFALDIETKFILPVGCTIPVDPEPIDCNTNTPAVKRKYPKDFTCEELTAPLTGLTAEQLADCLDCDGNPGGSCPVTFEIYLHDVLEETIIDVDPCATDNAIEITLT